MVDFDRWWGWIDDNMNNFALQWPDEEDVPGFKATYLRYLAAAESLSYEFTGLAAEALGLPPDGLAQFYDARGHMQHRSKVRPASLTDHAPMHVIPPRHAAS
jgi:hypothetical protein